MTLTMLECFIAGVETLNFTTAAQKIHITQPAFSRNVASLEEELGFKLFIRSKKQGLRVTPAGLEFYNGLIRIYDDFDKLKEGAARINRGEEGWLRIGIIMGMCVDSMTMNAINRFRKEYPKVEVSLRCYPLRQMLEKVSQGECDICFSIGNSIKGYDQLLCEDIFRVHNYLAVPSSLGCDREKEYSLSDFKDQYFLLSEDTPQLNELLLNDCRGAGFEPKTKMAPDHETKMLWTEFGQGLSVNSKEHYLKNSVFVDFVRVKEIGSEGYSMIWRKDNYNPAIALFYSLYDI